MSEPPAPRFDHLLSLSNKIGTFEHARLRTARPEHGYCTDDMARVLVVTAREPAPSPAVCGLSELSLRFLDDARCVDGDYRNRRNHRGHWEDRPSVEDCWGRAIWGLGTAAALGHSVALRQSAIDQFNQATRLRSPWPRSAAFAVLGAAEILSVQPDNGAALGLVIDAADRLGVLSKNPNWVWPEERLTYANAVLPEAMLAAGSVLGQPQLLEHGLELLAWLLDHETRDGHLSVTPVGGARSRGNAARFDQQPIEVAAIADGCARAATIDGSECWDRGVAMAVAWFLGENDASQVMWDAETGGGYDGLHADRPNQNQGAESTLALLSTLQHGRRLVMASP